MEKLFTPPYGGVLLILSIIISILFVMILAYQHEFLILKVLAPFWITVIIFSLLNITILKEPPIDFRVAFYFFICWILIYTGIIAAITWGWEKTGDYLLLIVAILFFYFLAITPFSNKNIQPIKFLNTLHNKIPHTIPPPLPPDYESPQMRFNKFLHKIFPFYSKPNSPPPEYLLIKQEQPQMPRYITTIDDIDKMEGTEFERFLKKLFENMGYSAELTNHTDMGADLIISKSGERVSVQAKRWSANVGNDAIQAVVGSLKVYKTQRGMVVTSSDFTNPAIYQAHHNHVELWNRDKLIEMITKYPVVK